MLIKKVTYEGSFVKEADCPDTGKPEYAFIGRSNVGKSSLINMLSGNSSLAHVSKQPGKTQVINFFLVNNSWYLVDLPGYGYAKVSVKRRREWKAMIDNYLVNRLNLQCAFVLIDSNVPPQKLDIEFINGLGEKGIPFIIVFTKVDRLRITRRNENIEAFKNAMLEYWNELPPMFETSAKKGEGRDEILNFIGEVNQRFESNQ